MNSQKAAARSIKASQKPKKLTQDPSTSHNSMNHSNSKNKKSLKRVFDQEVSLNKKNKMNNKK